MTHNINTRRDETAERITDAGLIAILRGDFSASQLVDIAEALVDGGVRVLELTLNSKDALKGIGQLQQHFGERALVGAGTVRTAQGVSAALAAGAHFLVSPNLDPESVALAQQHSVVHLPGVFTASEAQRAQQLGCTLLKLFPADALGPSLSQSLARPAS